MPEDHFGESVAARYDDPADEMFDPVVVERTVAFLTDLARGGAALELGIGTGRIALPLQAAGVSVHGTHARSATSGHRSWTSMAQLTDMTLMARWGDWDRRPFTSESDKHVSVWQKQVAV